MTPADAAIPGGAASEVGGGPAPRSGSTSSGYQGKPSRTRGRRKALDVLFEADQRRVDAGRLGSQRLDGEDAAAVFARDLVAGAAEHAEEVDEAIETYSLGWPLRRMPAVDRAIARLGAYEILFCPDVPDPVVLGEAADLAGELSTPKSADFLSGVLGRISAMKPQ